MADVSLGLIFLKKKKKFTKTLFECFTKFGTKVPNHLSKQRTTLMPRFAVPSTISKALDYIHL